jgi:nitrogen fixation/metabolism regulation signal transduction histidine kinase
MRAVPKLGFRREVLILVPASLLVLLVLAVFTLLSYRSAVAAFAEDARSGALRAVRDAASRLARDRATGAWPPSAEHLATLVPGSIAIALVDAQGAWIGGAGNLPQRAPLGPFHARRPAEAAVVGPSAAIGGRVIAVSPLGAPEERHYLRVDFEGGALTRQQRNVQVLSVVVIGLGLGVAALSVSFARHLVAPLDTLLERARAALPGQRSTETDEIPFLLETFDRALAALSGAPDQLEEDEISVLGRALTPSLDCGLLLLSPQGRVLALNALGRSLLVIEEPVSGQSYDDLLRQRPDVAQVLRQALVGGRVDPRTEVAVTGVSPPRSLGITVHELRRESLEVRGYLVLFADLTDVKRRAEQRRLSESLAHMGELTAGIAHEMRNSLTSLRGYLSRAEKQTQESPLRQDLEEIRHEADHLKRILDDFLSFAQPGTVRMEEVSLERVVRRAASDLEIAGKSVAIHSSEPESPRAIRRVWGDEQLLERAVRNLLQNAADAEEEAGRASRPLAVHIDFTDSGASLVVDDQGTGLRPEMAERLFVPFASHKPKGVGLGLALARRILDLHGATLEIENREEGGVRACVRFPASSVVGRGDGPGEDRERCDPAPPAARGGVIG